MLVMVATDITETAKTLAGVISCIYVSKRVSVSVSLAVVVAI